MRKLFVIILLSSIVYAQNGLGDYALNFDGTDDYVDIDAVCDGLDGQTAYSMEAWINVSSFAGNGYFISFNDGEGGGDNNQGNLVQLGVVSDIGGGKLKIYDDAVEDVNVTEGTTLLTTGLWYHIALVVDAGGSATVYLNGKAEITTTLDAEVHSITANDYASLGQEWDGGKTSTGNFFEGFLDEVRFWSDERTPAEILENMYKDVSGQTNLVTYYKMSEGTGTSVTDNSPNGNIGTLINGSTWKASGCFGGSRQALDFDGMDDYVTIADDNALDFGTNDFTFEFWAYCNDISGRHEFFNKRNVAMVNDISIWVEDGDLIFYTAEDAIATKKSWVRSVDPVISTGKWYHIAGTRDAGTLKLYLNGKQVGGDDSNHNTARDITNANPLILGKNAGGYLLDGKLDEFRVWSDARSLTEIQENMMKTLVGNEANLVAYYRFDQMAGTTVYNMASNILHHGTLTNMDETTDWGESDAFNTWVGSESVTWSNSNNWTNGSIKSNQSVGIYDWTLANVINYEATISGAPSIHNMLISSTASPTLNSNLTLSGNLVLRSAFDITSYTVDLGANGTLIEVGANIAGGSGNIRANPSLNNITTKNVAGLGAEITTAGNMGATQIIRKFTAQSGSGMSGIDRSYDIIPTNNSGLNATLTINYLDGEMNGLTEADFKLMRSTDGGTSWTNEGGIVNTGNNTITVNSVDAFSSWTTGIGSPEMVIKGNGTEITDGDNLPAAADDTDFEDVDIGSTKEITYRIENTGTEDLTLTTPISLNGTHSDDFTVTQEPASPVSHGGGTTTFKVEFSPSASGNREASISIANNDSDEDPYNFDIQGGGANSSPTGSDDNVSIAEGYSYTFQKSDFTYNDADGDTMSGIRIMDVTLRGDLKHNGEDVIIDTDYLDVTKLKFTPIPGENGLPYTNFTFKLKDQTGLYSNSIYTMTINVSEGDSPPSVNNSIADITVLEDADDYLVTLDTLFTDPDNDDNKIVKSVINNTDTTLVNTDIDYNSLTLDFIENQNGSSWITVKGVSNSISIIDSFKVIVSPVNDSPVGSDTVVTTLEDIDYNFSNNDFIFSDIENHNFAGISVISIEDNGHLKYNGTNVKLDTNYSDMSQLIFIPDSNEYGTPYSNFTFKLKDSGGAISDSVYTLTINVTAVDDPPYIVKEKNISVNEDASTINRNLADYFSDVDNSDNNISYSMRHNELPVIIFPTINKNILSLDFAPDSNGTGKIAITATSNNKMVTDTTTVTIHAVNDVPFGGNDTVTMNKNTTYTFKPGDFTYQDIEQDEFDGIQMVKLVDAGTFTCYDEEVKVSDKYYPDVTKLKFTPDDGTWGSPYTTFTFRVRDKQMAFSDSAYTMTINVLKNDMPPYINLPLEDIVVAEDAPNSEITIDSLFADDDNETINKSVIHSSDSSLVIATVVEDTLVLDYQSNQNGNCEVIVKGESESLWVTDTVMVTVTPINDAPFSQDKTITIKEDFEYRFKPEDFFYSDVEDHPFSGIIIDSDVNKGILSYDGSDISTNKRYPDITLLTYVPEDNRVGTPYTAFQFRVQDSLGLNSDSTYTIAINVINVNDKPYFTQTMADTIVRENQQLWFDYDAVDPDNDSLFYHVSGIQTNNGVVDSLKKLMIDSLSGELQWQIGYDQAGDYDLYISVTDRYAGVYDTVFVQVENVNRPPEFKAILPDTIIDNQAEFFFNYEAFDPDGDDLFFALKDSVTGLSLTTSGELTWTIPSEPEELYTITSYVTDKMDTVMTAAEIEVVDVVSVDREEQGYPTEFTLNQNFPNPFNPQTTIKYGLPRPAHVKISIYDINGQLVETIQNRNKGAGYHQVIWEAGNSPTGIYFYKLQAGPFTTVKKCILMK